MMLKANGEYLDFNGDIEIESQIKLFEEISTSNGEFSYDIEMQDNGFNRKILGIPRADTVKIIYQEIPSEVIDDTGQSIFIGKLQVNRVSGGIISSTFFAGNTEWFAMLSNPLSSLPLYRYDVSLTAANIQASWSQTDGLVFPIIDTGALVTRSYKAFKTEDFTACFYVKTLFNEIFNPLGIKLQGDFINDSTYDKLVIASNTKSSADIESRSSYVKKTTVQNNITTSETKITFQDETTFPYFDGSMGNFSNSTYTADVKMVVKVEINLTIDLDTSGILATGAKIRFYKNAIEQFAYVAGASLSNTTITTSKSVIIALNPGDTIEIYALEEYGSGNIDVNSGSIRVTPTYIYRVFGVSSVPNWTQGEFVSNILRIFNVLPSYNASNKTLTLDLFNKIKDKPYIDLSDEIVVDAVDYSEMVSNYAKNNYFKYQESDDEDLRQYNIENFIKYGDGNIPLDNAYVQNDTDIIESDFTSPITYLNTAFDISMERINFVELEDVDSKSISSVVDGSVAARFNISNADDLFSDGDLVRLETTLDGYNGEWVVSEVTATYIELVGLDFDATATGTATLLRHKFTTDDNVYLFVNVANVSNLFFSSNTNMRIDDTNVFQNSALAYFNLLSNETPINKVYKQSLSFGTPNNPLNYQATVLDIYWGLFSRILNSPVKAIGSGYLKRTTFDNIKTFLSPIMIQTEETRNLYYFNRNSGYKGSERPCNLELIKLN